MRYLTKGEVLALHQMLLEQSGGTTGIRDQGELDSALAQPEMSAFSIQKALRKAQRKLARRKRGSKSRERARLAVAKIHRKVQRQRTDFLHKLSTRLVKEFDLIAIEDLNLQGLNKGMLAKPFNDTGICTLFQMLAYKAENAGKRVVKVNPLYTSQDCSGCGERQKMPLWERKYMCKACGLIEQRDVNAAKNILGRTLPRVA